MTRLDSFVPDQLVSLQAKLLKAGNRTAMDSHSGKFPIQTQQMSIAGSLPESLWLVAHKIVAFTQGFVLESKWSSGALNWMFVREPWWTLQPTDYAGYADMFTKQEWLSTFEVLSKSHAKMTRQVETEKFTPEAQALLWFLKDSQKFAEHMYRRK